ncbi:Peroxiredoxin-6 [Manis pentadactyla]|nr:Peroxiredoxin-6 [Manis pentadactyla]
MENVSYVETEQFDFSNGTEDSLLFVSLKRRCGSFSERQDPHGSALLNTAGNLTGDQTFTPTGRLSLLPKYPGHVSSFNVKFHVQPSWANTKEMRIAAEKGWKETDGLSMNQSKPVLHEQMLFPMETVLQDLRWMLLLANDQMCTITKLEEENHDGLVLLNGEQIPQWSTPCPTAPRGTVSNPRPLVHFGHTPLRFWNKAFWFAYNGRSNIGGSFMLRLKLNARQEGTLGSKSLKDFPDQEKLTLAPQYLSSPLDYTFEEDKVPTYWASQLFPRTYNNADTTTVQPHRDTR